MNFNKELRVKILNQLNMKNTPLPLLTLEEFFEGNKDEGSIGCNLLEHPSIEVFHSCLKEIRDKETVQGVFVEVMEYEWEWPFSERVYILSVENEETVSKWLQLLAPSDISEGFMYGKPKEAPKLIEGYKVYSVWWD